MEERFRLDALDPPYEAGGTGDFVHYNPSTKTLEVVDLKNGVGVVEVEENKQLRTYGFGALIATSRPSRSRSSSPARRTRTAASARRASTSPI